MFGFCLPMRLACTCLCVAGVRAAWQLVWSDEFDGDAVNTTNWNVYNDTYEGSNQIELYTADNVMVSQGNLILRTRPENVTIDGVTYNITSGRVDSKGKVNITYGRIETRAVLQNPAAIGIHTAHWMLGAEQPCWPPCGELDIMEFEVEHEDWQRSTATYHWGVNCSKDLNPRLVGDYPPGLPPGQNPSNFSAGYTVFAVEWNATSLQFFHNDTNIISFYTGMPAWPNVTIPDWPMYLLFSQAYMSHRAANPPDWAWPVLQLVDYVRWYQWV